MGFIKRNFNIAVFFKFMFILTAVSGISSINYFKIILKYYDEGCILDAFNVLPQNYVFPLLAVSYGVWCVYSMTKNVEPMRILRYADKRRMWFEQCVYLLVTSAGAVISACLGSMAAASLYFSQICNWDKEYSFMRQIYREDKINISGSINILMVMAGSVITFFLLFWITGMIVLIMENMTGSVILSALTIAVIGGIDTLSLVTGKSFFYCRFQISRIMWVKPEIFFYNFIILAIFSFLLLLIGRHVIERREYF